MICACPWRGGAAIGGLSDPPPPQLASSAAQAKRTPFLEQYFAAKARHPEALLFFRMGDFYELFFEDAEKAAAALDITLTKRGSHDGDPIPMAGVPWRQAEIYLARLIRAGFKVAVCEQVEDPAEARKRGGKAIVRREVTRLVTAGTLTEEGLLEARTANCLAALVVRGEEAALAFADISTGAFHTLACAPGALSEEILALSPSELLAGEEDGARKAIQAAAEMAGAVLTLRPGSKADPRYGARRACAVFEVAGLDAFGDFTEAELAAIGLLIDYVELTQAGAAPRLEPPKRLAGREAMAIDAATRISLELERSTRGGREGSLLHAIDRTLTPGGARLLSERLARPSLDRTEITARLAGIAFFLAEEGACQQLRALLKGLGDPARALTRLALGRGGPRDLASLAAALAAGEQIRARLALAQPPDELAAELDQLSLVEKPVLAAWLAQIGQALESDLPVLARDGGFIQAGFDPALDEARGLRDDSRRVIAALQAQYSEQAGLTLKIRHNAVLGYHLDATPKQAEALMRPPLNADFQHRQSLAGSIRFTTPHLAELDAKISRAGEQALARELALFRDFAAVAASNERAIRAIAQALAVLDVASANSVWAKDNEAIAPEITDGQELLAEGARHPVVARALDKAGKTFTPNDVRLDGEGQLGPRLLLVTGPNMAGKSTYLRQIALLAILAQAGCYVPARRLKLGLTDRVFSRVGASDDLARGRSTFMTEMVETAAILHQAGPRALVILDEIGRGTATFDGLAIAWACAEHLHDVNRCRAVFATHYHELTILPERLACAANANLRAKEWKGDLVFLHEVVPGAADRSYGVQVAKLAGVPKRVVERARAVLARLEAGQSGRIDLDSLTLFSGQPASAEPSALEAMLQALEPDSLSPREALEALYRLKALLLQN